MKTEHKKFKPFERVLVKNAYGKWVCDMYSHYDKDEKNHLAIGFGWALDNDIFPYEGNESLVGTSDDPEEEIELENGEYCFGSCRDDFKYIHIHNWNLFQFDCVDDDNQFKERFGGDRYFDFAIRFSDFNPLDLEETKKHILYVKDGKIVKYKG